MSMLVSTCFTCWFSLPCSLLFAFGSCVRSCLRVKLFLRVRLRFGLHVCIRLRICLCERVHVRLHVRVRSRFRLHVRRVCRLRVRRHIRFRLRCTRSISFTYKSVFAFMVSVGFLL